MSSILRALKKLENDPRHQEENRALDSKFVPLADTGLQKKSPGTLVMVIGGGVVCGLVILAGWWLLMEKPQQPAGSRQVPGHIQALPDKASDSPETSTLPEASAPGTGAVISPETAKPVTTTAAPPEKLRPAVEPPSKAVPEPSAPLIVQKDVLSVAEQEAPPVNAATRSQSKQPVDPTASREAVATEAAPPAPAPAEPETIEIPLLTDTDLKLQAITWSKNPQKRIAVINNNILRQGETVAGYRIEVINQDDIVLSTRGIRWKLPFRIR